MEDEFPGGRILDPMIVQVGTNVVLTENQRWRVSRQLGLNLVKETCLRDHGQGRSHGAAPKKNNALAIHGLPERR